MKKNKEKEMKINRLAVDPKSTNGVDSTTGYRAKAMPKDILKKDISSPFVDENDDPEEKAEKSGEAKNPENEREY